MNTMIKTRTVERDGSIKLTSGECSFRYFRPRPGVIEVVISGVDDGQFGTSTLDELLSAIAQQSPLEIFIDARDGQAPAVSVSKQWTSFFSEHRHELKRVSILVGSKVLSLTMAIAQHQSRTGRLIQIYSDPDLFDQQRQKASQGG